MAVMMQEMARSRCATATVEVLGEEMRTRLPIPTDGTTAAELLRSAGVGVREQGWDLFVDGVRRGPDHPIEGTKDLTLTYVPRTRGA